MQLFQCGAWNQKKKQITNIKKYNQILTYENHFQDGGFGSWLNESISQVEKKINTIINSRYINEKVVGKVGTEKYLDTKYGPS